MPCVQLRARFGARSFAPQLPFEFYVLEVRT